MRWRTAGFFGLLGLVAGAVQVVAALLAPVGLYYPDAFCYVVVPKGAPCSGHPPGITMVWRILGLGVLSEHRVLVVQAVLGVASVLLLGWALRSRGSDRVALVLAGAFALLPLRLFFTRTLMTETVETFFICAFLAAAVQCTRPARWWSHVGWQLVASACLGAAASVHFAFLPVAIGLWVAMVAITTLQAPWVGLARGRRLPGIVGSSAVALLVLLATMLPAALDEHRWYGTLSGNPVQGTTLVARWSPLLGCTAPAGSLPMTRTVIAAACRDRTWASPPGKNVDAMWNPPISDSLLRGPDESAAQFAAVQGQLTAIVRSAMLAHPAAVVRQVVASLAWQVVGSPYDDVPGFHSAASDVATGDWTLGVPAFPNLATWFDGHPAGHHGGSIAPMLTVVSGTLRLAQVLLWLALAGSLVRLVQRWGRRRQGQRVDPLLDLRPLPGEGRRWLTMEAGPLLGVVAGTGLLLAGLATAVGSMPSFHYELPITPFVLVILGLCLTRPGYVEVPAPEVNCSGLTEMNSASDSAIRVSPA